MAKSLVSRMAKGFTAPKAAKAPKSNKVTAFAPAAYLSRVCRADVRKYNRLNLRTAKCTCWLV